MKAGRITVKGRLALSELVSGGIFVAVGAVFLLLSSKQHIGTASEMGPGYFPILLSFLLIFVGGALVVRSFFVGDAFEVIPRLRPILAVMLGLVGFALLVRPLGFMVASFLGVFLSACGGEKFRWKSALLLSGCLAISTSIIFVKGLGLPFPLIGAWMR